MSQGESEAQTKRKRLRSGGRVSLSQLCLVPLASNHMSLYSFDSFLARIKNQGLFENIWAWTSVITTYLPSQPHLSGLHPIHSSGLLCAILQGQRQCHSQLFASLPRLAALQNFLKRLCSASRMHVYQQYEPSRCFSLSPLPTGPGTTTAYWST